MKQVAIIIASFLISSGCGLGQNQVVSRLDSRSFSSEQVGIVAHHANFLPNGAEVSIGLVGDQEVATLGLTRMQDTLWSTVNASSTFEIGSISKVFTSMLLANAVIEGKIQLYQTIATVLEFPLIDGKHITFRQLANHTSGLPRLPSNFDEEMAENPDNPYANYTDQDLEKYLTYELRTKNQSGAQYEYSNLGAGILGYLLTRIYRVSYETLLQEKICQTLQLTSTTSQRSSVDSLMVGGLDRHGRPTSNWDFQALAGAGALLSSVLDLAEFARFSFNQDHEVNRIVQEKTIEVNEKMAVALGWHIIDTGSKECLWHNGGTGGYRSSLAVLPRERKSVIILSNVSAFHAQSEQIDELCFALLETLN